MECCGLRSTRAGLGGGTQARASPYAPTWSPTVSTVACEVWIQANLVHYASSSHASLLEEFEL